MKQSYIIVVALFVSTLTIAAPAEQNGVFKFVNADVSKLLEAYRAMTGLELIVASGVDRLPETVTVASKEPMTASEAAQLMQRALLLQAGVIITRLDQNRASVTYNDRLRKGKPEDSAQLQKLRQELGLLLQQYTDLHPKVKQLRQQIADLEARQAEALINGL